MMERSLARESFLQRMSALTDAVQSEALESRTLRPGNEDPARLLRNGVAVVGFAAFEDFFIARTAEILHKVDPAIVPFGDLPAKLKLAATWGAVQTLVFRARLDKDSASRLALIQDHSEILASTARSSYRISPLAFAPQGSNLAAEDIEAALKALLLHAPWQQMTAIASRVGFGLLGLNEVFSASAGNRHSAAHVAAADMNLSDVQELPVRLRVVALSVDVLMSHAVKRLPVTLKDKKGSSVTVVDEIAIRFVDATGQKFREHREGGSRALKLHGTLEGAITNAVSASSRSGEIIVVRDHQGLPLEWFVP